MIARIGNRFPRLFFSDEGGPHYFKEDVVLPEDIPQKPEGGRWTMSDEKRRDMFIYCTRKSVGIAAGKRISDRILATVRVAELLGVSDIVAFAKRGEFLYEGEKLFGTVTPAIRGANLKVLDELSDMRGYSLSYTVPAVRQLTQLLILDFICGQIDRHSRNIKLDTDIDFDDFGPPADGREHFLVKSICAIDHDMSFGPSTYEDIKKKVSKGLCVCPELFGRMQYTAVDEPLCDRIFGIEKNEYRDALLEYLGEDELFAFFDRIDGLKRAVLAEKENEEKMRTRGEEFFSRFVSTDEDYSGYLYRMEEAAAKGDNMDMRFSYHPSYLKKKILLHTPLSGGA